MKPRTKLTPDEITIVCEALLGTCRGVDEMLESYELPAGDYALEQIGEAMDDHGFLCTGCEWWCEISEQNVDAREDSYCDDCASDAKQAEPENWEDE